MTYQTIGIRKETKSIWERRCPLIPSDIDTLRQQGIPIVVQSSADRAFTDVEFDTAGIPVQEDLNHCDIILGIKEIPWQEFQPDKTYLFFAHVIKGQPHNMPMLRRMLALNTTLIDYEKIVDEQNRRLIFFGRHAGLAGMINSLWALGRKLALEGIANPFDELQQAREYPDLKTALAAVDKAAGRIQRQGLPVSLQPLVTAFIGYGNVSAGAQEVFDRLPHITIQPADVKRVSEQTAASADRLLKVVFKEEDCYTAKDGAAFDLADYYHQGAARYQSCFEPVLPYLTLLMHCSYWDYRYPRLVTRAALQELWAAQAAPRLRVIGDISCDVEGSVEATLKATDPGHPVYVYEPLGDTIQEGFEGRGPVIMAVEILPTEIPREASESFSAALVPLIPALAAADYRVPFTELALPDPLKRAVIACQGKLTPDYEYLQGFLNQS